MSTFKQLRVLFALLVLLFVVVSTTLTERHLSSWSESLTVYIYPINADNTPKTQRYIDSLGDRHFNSLERFMSNQSKRYLKLDNQPFTVSLSPQVNDKPPPAPHDGSIPEVMWWSMKLRFWSWTHNTDPGPEPDIQIYTLYYDPANIDKVPHSVGLSKGQISVVHAFADQSYNQSNNIVIAHELMHTLGATDKYNLQTGQPIYPGGYANPDRIPLHPQTQAALMGGRIPVTTSRSVMPRHFSEVMINAQTAREISWLK